MEQPGRRVLAHNSMEDLPVEVMGMSWEEFQYKTILNAMRDVIEWMDKWDAELMAVTGEQYGKVSVELQQNGAGTGLPYPVNHRVESR